MDILETIIRGVLLENATKAKLRSMDAADFQIAKRAGAVFAYYAIVKGVSDEKTLLNAVAGATLGSQNTDTRVGVGGTSQYANGKFVYVVNTDDIQRKNVAAVWIMPALPTVNSTGSPDKSKVQTTKPVNVPQVGLKIGQSDMISKSAYMKRADTAKTADPTVQVADVSQMPENETKLQQLIDKGKDVLNIDGGKTADTSSTATATTTQAPGAQTGYPRDVEGVKVYTMSDTDDYVYAKINGSWKFIEKKSFEANPKLAVITKNLNPAGVKNVETKFGLSTVSNQNQNQNQNQGGGGGNQGGLKKGAALNWNVKENSKIPRYYYDTKLKKFIKFKQTWVVGSTKPKYQSTSKDGKYYLVDLAGDKVWIDRTHVK
jgi:hypothetical protein